MFDLSERVVLVTGATGGIGESLARSFYRQGAQVIITGTRSQELDQLSSQLGERAYAINCDLSRPEGAIELIGAAKEALDYPDILINNAGITRDSLSMRMQDKDFIDVMNINLVAAFRLSRACLKSMMKARFGRIISITSVVGSTGNAGQVNYAASKAGLTGFTKSLALEVASRGITANCIAPGFIVTPMTDSLNNAQKEQVLSSIPVGILGQADDVAAAAIYLASNESAYVTGQTLHVNGGMAMI